MKITAIEIKPGMIIEHKNDFWKVLKTQHVKPGKGGAFNQVELKSLVKGTCLLYTSPSPRDLRLSRMPSSA